MQNENGLLLDYDKQNKIATLLKVRTDVPEKFNLQNTPVGTQSVIFGDSAIDIFIKNTARETAPGLGVEPVLLWGGAFRLGLGESISLGGEIVAARDDNIKIEFEAGVLPAECTVIKNRIVGTIPMNLKDC